MRTLLTHTRRSPCNTLTVQELYLHENQIGDAGVIALADACASGSLLALKEILIDAKHMRHPQLVAACQPRGIAIR